MRDKRDIRREIRLLTQQLTHEKRVREADFVTRYLEDIINHKRPTIVAAFMPLPDEIPIDVERLNRLCHLLIPRITSDDDTHEMEFFDYTPSEISQGSYGISEPQSGKAYKAEDIDMIIIPGVAFTSKGERLGRGKGFYDRYLARHGFKAYCIGVCFRHQLLDAIPTEEHDHLVDEVIICNE